MMSEDQFSLVCAIAKAAEGSSWEADQASPTNLSPRPFPQIDFLFAFLSLTKLCPPLSASLCPFPQINFQGKPFALWLRAGGDHLLVVVTFFQRSHAV